MAAGSSAPELFTSLIGQYDALLINYSLLWVKSVIAPSALESCAITCLIWREKSQVYEDRTTDWAFLAPVGVKKDDSKNKFHRY